MANQSQTGFKPIKTMGGSLVTLQRQQVRFATTAIFQGDCVWLTTKSTATGICTMTDGANGVQRTFFLSVARGASYLDAGGYRTMGPYLPAGSTKQNTTYDDESAAFAFCVDNFADTIFEAQISGTSAVGTLRYQNVYSATVAGTGSTYNGLSGHTLNGTFVSTPQNWRMIDYPRRSSNDLTLATSKAWCRPALWYGGPHLAEGLTFSAPV